MLELFDNKMFPCEYSDILDRVNSFNPNKYSTTRNYINGSVSYLSPYISRGVISTKFILGKLLHTINIIYSRLKNLFRNLHGEITGNRYGFGREMI